jgi:SSS family solute:Na+ symporter
MHWIDILMLFLYFGMILALGFFRSTQKPSNAEDYILAGRKLSLPAFTATLVTTWYGGILGIGENTYLYGVQTWFIFALPYYVFALIYAFWIAPKIRNSNHFSIPDHFRKSYGKEASILSAIYIFILSSPAPYILSMGILIQFIFNIPFGVALVLASGFSLIYVWKGGFKSVIRTDILQFVLMFLGFSLLLFFAWKTEGSPIHLFNTLPKSHTSPLGGNSIQYLLVWFFIASWTFIDPGFYQRSAAAKTPDVAKKGILMSILFWGIFDGLTLLTGLYAVQLVSPENPLFSFPLLGKTILPPFAYGLFLAGIFSTLMSTIDSLGFINSITFGRDMVGQIKKDANTIQSIKTGLIITSVFALGLAYILPSVVKLFFTLGSVIIPGLILPFVLTLWKPEFTIQNIQANLWILFPVLVSLIWMGISLKQGSPFLSIEAFYPGMLTSLGMGIIVIKLKNGIQS